MKSLDLTLSTPQLNLACDEALLEWCEAGQGVEILRFWEPQSYFVVLGSSGRAATEVHVRACQQRRIPILRRCSGGGAVLQGPGCLNYSLVLKIAESGPLTTIDGTNAYILGRHKEALKAITAADIAVQGATDLAVGDTKFSGNAQRRKRSFTLFHGTFLLRFDIARMETLLPMPTKEPPYRKGRSHTDFLTNLNLPAEILKGALTRSWGAKGRLEHLPLAQIEKLAQTRFSSDR